MPEDRHAPTLRPAALITGASSGIGAELARVFARDGHELVLVARRAERLAALAADLSAGSRRPTTIALDLARHDAVAQITQAMADAGAEPSYVVNNAGFGLVGSAARLERAEQLAMVDLNVRTLTELSLAWIDSLERHRGGILNLASVAAFLPGPGMAVYYASKAYVLSFTQALHEELKPRGIAVTALCPGPVRTEFQARAGVADRPDVPFLSLSAARVAQEGYDALMANRAVLLPGLGNKAIAALPRILPRSRLRRLTGMRRRHAQKTRPGA